MKRTVEVFYDSATSDVVAVKRKCSPSLPEEVQTTEQSVAEEVIHTATFVKSGEIFIDCLPFGHFSLGGNKFLVVNDYTGEVKIHLRSYSFNGRGYVPTKYGFTIKPPTFYQLVLKCLSIEGHGGPLLIGEDLLVHYHASCKNSVVSFQKLYTDRNKLYHVAPGGIMLNEKQFETFEDICDQVWGAVQDEFLGTVFKATVKETRLHQSECLATDALDLKAVLWGTITRAIRGNITKVFKCNECGKPSEMWQANQLAHECITTGENEKWTFCHKEAMTLLQPKLLALSFTEECNAMKQYIPDEFIDRLVGREEIEHACAYHTNRW